MKIKYLQNTHDSLVGDVKDIQDLQANILILRGFAEIYVETVKTQVKADKKA